MDQAHVSIFKKYFFLYLFEKGRKERERERKRENDSFMCWITPPKWPQQPGAPSGSPTRVATAQVLEPSSAVFRYISEDPGWKPCSWDWKQHSAMIACPSCKQWFNLQHHNTSPCTFQFFKILRITPRSIFACIFILQMRQLKSIRTS